MANYQYDESGVLASYFVLTFLSLVLIPLSFSFIPSSSQSEKVARCDCKLCQEKSDRLRKATKRSILKPRLGAKALIAIVGWVAFAFLAHKVATTTLENSVYNPFDILGINAGSTEKEIKRHYKKLSLKFHPDKVKLAINQTLEEASAKYIELTKAYKSLTDEEIRQNLEKYGHPDGKQEFSMGLALPTWVIASKNNIWILAAYGVIFGLGLPALVGRWWFGSRKYTKDGVVSKSAEIFFKSVREETTPIELVNAIAKVWEYEGGDKFASPKHAASGTALGNLESSIKSALGDAWTSPKSSDSIISRRAKALLYAHLLRIPLKDVALEKEQAELLLQTPALLTSMLSMALAHNWLTPTINVMHLHAHLTQAVFPGSSPLLQFPDVEKDETKSANGNVVAYIKGLEAKQDPRSELVKTVADKWGRLECVDAQFKVIGERIVTPEAIVQLVFKLRIVPPTTAKRSLPAPLSRSSTPLPDVEPESKEALKKEELFLAGKKDAEDLEPGAVPVGEAHAPFWPGARQPQWWIMIGDQKLNKVIVPPMKFGSVPYSRPNLSLLPSSSSTKDYRTYKLQFQAPPQVGVYTFQLNFISDSFLGDDVKRFIVLKVENLTAEDDQDEEDDISEPDEDTLAGQMAAMRGGKVKRSPVHGDDDDEYDDESSTDDDIESGGSDSDSDSD